MAHSHWVRRLALGGLAAVLTAMPHPGAAQGPSDAHGASAMAASPAGGTVTLQLQQIPLRAALETLFHGTGRQYSVAPAVPDYPVTLSLQDEPFDTALRTMLRLSPGVTFRKEGEIYLVGLRAPTPALAASESQPSPPPEAAETEEEEGVERISLNFVHPAVLAYVFNGTLLPTEDQVLFGLGGAAGGGTAGAGIGGSGSLNGGGLGPGGLGHVR